MDKTIKQIADELQIDKQKVYRFIKKNCIKEAHQNGKTMYYDEVAQNLVKTAFCGSEAHQMKQHETHQKHINDERLDKQLALMEKTLETLQKQLEQKDTEINNLNKRLEEANNLVNQEQVLHGMTKKRVEELEARLPMPKQPGSEKQDSHPAAEPSVSKSWWKFWQN